MARLAERLQRLPPGRIVIAGGPRSGKTTLAQNISRHGRIRVRGTDELLNFDWSESSLIAAAWFEQPGPWICEGVVMPRALRKWLARDTSNEPPADTLVFANRAVNPRSRGQEAMATGCATVWEEILPELERRGAEIINA